MRINQFTVHKAIFHGVKRTNSSNKGLSKSARQSRYSKTKLALNPHDKANPLKFTQFCLKFSEFVAFFAIMPL